MKRYPLFLTRSQAIEMTGLSRKRIEHLVDTSRIRVFRTPGDHRRFMRDDLIKHIHEQSNRQACPSDPVA